MAHGDRASFHNSGEGSEQHTHERDEGYLSELDSSDSENDEVPKAFETLISRGSGKRTYGILIDDLHAERRLKNAKLDEQIGFLRSILPDITPAEEKASVLMHTYQYIMKLQKSVDELNAELIPLSAVSANMTAGNPAVGSHQEEPGAQSTSSNSVCVSNQHPMVEVKREDGKLEVHIACMNRPGLLVDIMSVLDSMRITVLHANITCHENVQLEALRLEKETLMLQPGPEPVPTEEEDQRLKDIIFRVILDATCVNKFQ